MNVDFIAEDKNGEPILFAEVKTWPASREDIERFFFEPVSADPRVSYGMHVDPESIVIRQRDLEYPDSFVKLQSADILSHYAPDYRDQATPGGSPRILRDYLRTLTEGWLRDIAYHWKSATPPASDELVRIGLLDRLKNGTTRSEVTRNGDRLYRDELLDEYRHGPRF